MLKTHKVKILHPVTYAGAKYERGEVREVTEGFMKSAGEYYYELLENPAKEEKKLDKEPKEAKKSKK